MLADALENPLTHDAELWFPDGSIVLQAEAIYFKIYAGILSQASPVFRDMFSLPQPPPSQPTSSTAQNTNQNTNTNTANLNINVPSAQQLQQQPVLVGQEELLSS